MEDLGLADRIRINPGVLGGTDATAFSLVGGRAIGSLNWMNPTFMEYYHTEFDTFRPEDFKNLGRHLEVGALSMIRMAQVIQLPINFVEMADWIEQELVKHESLVSNAPFRNARDAIAQFRHEAERIEEAREKPGPCNRRVAEQMADANSQGFDSMVNPQ